MLFLQHICVLLGILVTLHYCINPINTLTSGLIQAVCKKTADSHVALCRNISAPVQVTDLVEASKDAANLVVGTQKIFFAWGCRFFVSDVLSGGLFGHLHLAAKPLDGSISL